MSDATDSTPQRDDKGRWLPGVSGNPGGHPGGTGLQKRLRDALASDDAQQAIIDAGIKAAREGDFRFWAYIFDRLEGPIKQQVAAEVRRVEVIEVDGSRHPDEAAP